MVNMDSGLPPSRKRKPVTKKELQRIQNGGKIADMIRLKKEADHAEELRDLDEQIKKDLSNIP